MNRLDKAQKALTALFKHDSENQMTEKDNAYWRRWMPGEPHYRGFTGEIELPLPKKTQAEAEAVTEYDAGDAYDPEYVYEMVVFRHKRESSK